MVCLNPLPKESPRQRLHDRELLHIVQKDITGERYQKQKRRTVGGFLDA